MARRRYLSTEISTDPRVNRLADDWGAFAALLYTWMIPHVDNEGGIKDEIGSIRLLVVPGFRSRTDDDVASALQGMIIVGLLEHDVLAWRFQFPWSDWDEITRTEVHPVRRVWNLIRAKVSPIVFDRDGYACVRCGSTNRLEVDHIVPIARGGQNDFDNYQTLCRPCNRRKWAH